MKRPCLVGSAEPPSTPPSKVRDSFESRSRTEREGGVRCEKKVLVSVPCTEECLLLAIARGPDGTRGVPRKSGVKRLGLGEKGAVGKRLKNLGPQSFAMRERLVASGIEGDAELEDYLLTRL